MALLDPLASAPGWQQLALGLVGLAVLGGGGHRLAIAPLESRVTALRAEHQAQQAEIARTRAMVADLARLRRQAGEVERRLEIAREKLPGEREMPALYRTLSNAAAQAGLAVTLFQPQGPRVRDFYSEIPIALVGEGGYHEVGDFVGRIATLPRTTTIAEFKLSGAATEVQRPPDPGPAPGRSSGPRPPADDPAPRPALVADRKPRHSLRAELTLLTYVYRPVGSPPAPKPAGAPRTEAPKP